MLSNPITYFHNLKQYFLSGGKKETMEKLFHKMLLKRASENKIPMVSLLNNCILNSTPYVQLKTRKRGKRVIYKVNFMEHSRGEKKSLSSLSQVLRKQKSGNFSTKLNSEIESLAFGKSSIMAKRDELHRLALQNTPYSWTFSSKKRKKSSKIV